MSTTHRLNYYIIIVRLKILMAALYRSHNNLYVLSNHYNSNDFKSDFFLIMFDKKISCYHIKNALHNVFSYVYF